MATQGAGRRHKESFIPYTHMSHVGSPAAPQEKNKQKISGWKKEKKETPDGTPGNLKLKMMTDRSADRVPAAPAPATSGKIGSGIRQ